MALKKLTGFEAIDFAEKHSLMLSKSKESIGGFSCDVTPHDARIIALNENPEYITIEYLEIKDKKTIDKLLEKMNIGD
jgi:hypothetical protein